MKSERYLYDFRVYYQHFKWAPPPPLHFENAPSLWALKEAIHFLS